MTTEMTMIETKTAASRSTRRLGLRAGLLAAACLALVAPAAAGQGEPRFGDDYGVVPVNDHPEAFQDAPAIPSDHAFWAGACDRAGAPEPGEGTDLSTLGDGSGMGEIPAEILAGTRGVPQIHPVFGPLPAHVPLPAPRTPQHCIDPGVQTPYSEAARILGSGPGTIWESIPIDYVNEQGAVRKQDEPAGDYAPSWRLPAEAQAGAHPDGTTTFAWNRSTVEIPGAVAPGQLDGSVDNVYVDLPPGFVGNPQAVPRCTAEQFSGNPLLCPPETQLGVIRLHLDATVCIFGGTPCTLSHSDDNLYPVYNLEPRQGNVAELGFAHAGGQASVRLVAKARTNSDFGVTAFVGQIPAALVPIAQSITIWGVPWAAENDAWRSKLGHYQDKGDTRCNRSDSPHPSPVVDVAFDYYLPVDGLRADCQATYEPDWGEIKPFFSSITGSCDASVPVTTLRTDSFQNQGAFTADGDPVASDPNWKTYHSDAEPVTGCEKLDFSPERKLSALCT